MLKLFKNPYFSLSLSLIVNGLGWLLLDNKGNLFMLGITIGLLIVLCISHCIFVMKK